MKRAIAAALGLLSAVAVSSAVAITARHGLTTVSNGVLYTTTPSLALSGETASHAGVHFSAG